MVVKLFYDVHIDVYAHAVQTHSDSRSFCYANNKNSIIIINEYIVHVYT